ncbi:MAG: thioredoxin domain-containing protein [Egibacteraceae bacterium]
MNRLRNASSPYLRQHADNPVDWQEWGEQAFTQARDADKPVFLSVGYASCHWCHVMAHESFEDDEVAAVLNERFVPVKVDREERPDVDRVYMDAVQAMTGHGGWPMSVFLTHEAIPFFGGTYWPKDDRGGMPGFLKVLDAVHQAWTSERDKITATGARLAAHLEQTNALAGPTGPADADLAAQSAAACVYAWDDRRGGFGNAPKFPQAMTIDFLLAHALRTGDEGAVRAAIHSLDAMARGGIYDHVGGGFARYSVDADWVVPHFEKMLYDNALLLRAYTHGALVAGEQGARSRFRRVVRESATYLIGELCHPDGGFYSSTDADSEGVEGKFFVWSSPEFREVVAEAGEDPEVWATFFDVTEGGNFEGATILTEPRPRDEDDEEFDAAYRRVRAALAARRAARVPPALDDKVLTSWNGLAIGALAEAGAALGETAWVVAARRAAGFVRDNLMVGGHLHHTWREGHGARVPAFAEDVALLAQGLLCLYEADGDPAWFAWARELAADADARFAEAADGAPTGAYFATAHDAETLLTRPKETWDNATPSAASVMADVHLRLAALTGEAEHAARAERVLTRFAPHAQRAPTGFSELLRALERYLGGPVEVAVVGGPDDEATRRLVAAYRETLRPGAVLAVGDGDGDGDGSTDVPLLAGRERVDGRPAAYVCRRFACRRPVTTPEALRAELADT